MLEKFSTKELLAEIAKRNQSGKDWYFSFNKEDDEENWRAFAKYGREYEIRTVWIVHKRFWHMNHYIDDRHIANFVKLPSIFQETQESLFDFKETYEEAAALLVANGFTELPAIDGWCALINQHITVAGKSHYISMHADTEEIKKAIEDNMAEWPKEFLSLADYEKTMQDVAESMGCIVHWFGRNACMMDKSIWDSLPPEPEELSDE